MNPIPAIVSGSLVESQLSNVVDIEIPSFQSREKISSRNLRKQIKSSDGSRPSKENFFSVR